MVKTLISSIFQYFLTHKVRFPVFSSIFRPKTLIPSVSSIFQYSGHPALRGAEEKNLPPPVPGFFRVWETLPMNNSFLKCFCITTSKLSIHPNRNNKQFFL